MKTLTLSSEGTVRLAIPGLEPKAGAERLFRFREVLGDDLFAAARELASFVGPVKGGARAKAALETTVTVLAGACLWAARGGSTRLPFGTKEEGPLHDVLEELQVEPRLAGPLFALADAGPPTEGPLERLLGRRGDFKPLIHDGDAFCIQRLVHQEDQLGAHLMARLTRPPVERPLAGVAEALRDVLARPPTARGSPVTLSPEQQRAMLAAAHQHLTVISGGPGTGKTSIIVSIVRLLSRLGVAPGQVTLAAPTGKAAHRMEEALAGALTAIADPSPEDRALLDHRPAPTTLHRLLGYSPGRDQFRHHARNQLGARVVIIDEASMIDLALMRHLLDAVPDDALLVLLGDAEQLPSVDAGAVLRDLVPPGAQRTPRPWDSLVTGGPPAAPSTHDDQRRQGAVRLTQSYRMDERDPAGRAIYVASQAVRDGQVPPPGAPGTSGPHLVLRTSAAEVAGAGVELLQGPTPERQAWWARWFAELVGAHVGWKAQVLQAWPLRGATFDAETGAAIEALDRHLQSARVLCLTRGAWHPSGAAAVNRVLEGHLRELLELAPALPGATALLPGTPVLMMKNDYALGLFNGDQGLALRVQRPDDAAPALRLLFRVRGEYQAFDPGALAGQVEPCWAMTVHKAQGSEFDRVTLVLPTAEEQASGGGAEGLACREVVYTAMTRARRAVTILGTPAALKDAVEHSLERWSALGSPARWLSPVKAAPGSPWANDAFPPRSQP